MPKKVLLYTDTPIPGGAELQMFLLAKFLNKKNYTPTLCCSNFAQLEKWQDKFRKENINIITLDVFHKHDPRHYFQLKKILPKFDLIHCHIWNPASCRYAIQAAKSTKTPIISTEHDPFHLSGIKNLIKTYQMKNIDSIITISNANKRFLTKEFPEMQNRIHLVHNGIDIEEFKSKLPKINKKHSEKTLLCIAALHKRKGIHLLLDAFAQLPAKYKHIRLLIAGSGPDEAEFKEQTEVQKTSDRIKFLGQRSDIPELLAQSDFFVLPSVREAFGLVLLEAMASRKPILTTRAGGIPEIISEKEGLLVEEGSSTALLKGLEQLFSLSEDKKNEMTECAYKKLVQYFSAKRMAEETEKLYDQII